MLKATVLLAALAASGCLSVPVGGARTLDQGRWQVQVGEGAFSVKSSGTHADGEPLEMLTGSTNMHLGVAYGVTDRVEVGGGMTLFGTYAIGSLRAKFALLRAPRPDAGVDLSLAPALAGWGLASETNNSSTAQAAASLQLPLLLGLNLAGGHQVILGASVANNYEATGGAETAALYAGGMLGFSWKITDGFRFFPQVAYGRMWPVWTKVSTSPTGPQDALLPASNIGQVSLAFLLGGD